MRRRVTALLGAAFGPATQSVMKGFRNQDEIDITILAVDADKESVRAGECFGCKTFLAPRADSPEYIQFLLQLVSTRAIDLYIPILNTELLAASRARERFREMKCAIFIPTPDMVGIGLSKKKTYEFCKTRGIPHASTCYDSLAARATLSFPMFVKPDHGVGAVCCHRVDDERELAFRTHQNTRTVIQEYIDGEEYTLDILANQDGHVLGVVPRMRMQTRAGIAMRCITVRDEELMSFGCRVAEMFGVVGACNIQCFRTRDKKILFSEINMRPAGSSVLSILAGFNYPLLLAKMALGDVIDARNIAYQSDQLLVRYIDELIFDEKRES